jgi:hypothetical protein
MNRMAALVVLVPMILIPKLAHAQGRGGAPIDITGYWVSLVTEDWRYRMMTPARGDFPSIPLNAEGRKLAMAWDPSKEPAANACKSYGAGNIMRTPGRLHITWTDDNTLKVEMDNGIQTRLFHFGAWKPPRGGATWQGDSAARWEFAGGRGRGMGGDLEVATTHVRPGYLQKNGVPYSANAVITEHFDLTHEPDGASLLIVTTLVVDPAYLTQRFQRSSHFRKQADAAGWDPTPCSSN